MRLVLISGHAGNYEPSNAAHEGMEIQFASSESTIIADLHLHLDLALRSGPVSRALLVHSAGGDDPGPVRNDP